MKGLVLLMCLPGCDGVFGIRAVNPTTPDAPPAAAFRCADMTPAPLLCGDFEQGNAYYASGVISDLPAAAGAATAVVDTPGIDGGHGLYINTTGDAYQVPATSTVPTSRMTATFGVELEGFDANTPATGLLVLSYDGVSSSECYVAVDFQPTPMRLNLVDNCNNGSRSAELVPSLPAHTVFVSVTVDMNLTTGMASARLGNASASVPISPSATMGQPSATFGIFDPLSAGGAHVAFDNVLVVTTP